MSLLKTAMGALGAAALAYVALAAAITLGQRRLIYRPEQARPSLPDIPGLQQVTLHTADGLELLAWYLPPTRPGAPVLAYFHGNGGSVRHRAPRLRRFAAWGWGVLMPEYRGYGGNPGTATEEGLALDAAAALAFLEAQGTPPERLVIYGESIGTGVAVRAAAGRPIGALVLESPFTSLAAIASGLYPYLPVDWLLRDRFDALGRITRVQSPLLVLQGGRDQVVPNPLGRAVFDAAHDPKELWFAPDAGHEDLAEFGAMEAVAEYLRRRGLDGPR